MFNKTKVPLIPDYYPKFGNQVTSAIGRAVLTALGWEIVGNYPKSNRLVIAVAPHTSNWDFVIGLAAKLAIGFRAHWLGKHTIFIWPFNRILRFLGGIPVNRHAAGNVVDQVADLFGKDEALLLAVAPEGTRKQVQKLKSGFIRIAVAADVPIFMIALDYRKKQLILGDLYKPTGNLEQDELFIRNYFKQFQGKYPEQYCP